MGCQDLPLNIGVEMDQGADFSLVIGVFGLNSASPPVVVPTDLTGYMFKGQMRDSTDPTGSAIAEFDFTILNQTTNTGQVMWSLSSTTIDAIVTSTATPLENNRLTTPFLFDIKMKNSSGQISRIVQGIIELSPEATQEVF